MENRKLIYLFGMIFSIVFAALYFFIFNNFITNGTSASKTVYFHQVGLYKDEANSLKTIEKLKENDIEAFPVKKDEVTAVVCNINEDVEQVKAQEDTLTKLGITFIEKQVKIEDADIVTLLENKEYSKVLEMMKY